MIDTAIIYVIEHHTMPELKYIGQTIQTLTKRWGGHVSTMKKFDRIYYRVNFLLNYYGIENFSIREYKIYKNISKEFLDNEENKYIYELGTMNTRGANEETTIKITNEMRNSLLNKLINQGVNLVNLYKLIYTFEYDYEGTKLDFIIDNTNKELLDDLLKKELENKLIGMEIKMTEDFYDENENKCCECFRISEPFMEEEMILEDFLKYIEYFHEHFQITNNKDDIYYSNDLIYGLQEYGEREELFDFYFLQDFPDIMQKYFNILNETFKNVSIDVNKLMIYGVKKKISISFKMIDEIEGVIRDYIQTINSSLDYDFSDFLDFVYNRKDDCLSKYNTDFDVNENKLDIEVLKDDIYTIWYVLYREKFKYDKEARDYDGGDDYIIYDNMNYSYDYYNLDYIRDNLFTILNEIIKKDCSFKLIDNKYIMLDEC